MGLRGRGKWLHDHRRDPYVRSAQAQGYRSRAAYKLIDIDQRERLLRPGSSVIELGASPGGWSQVVAAKIGGKGRLIMVDLLPMEPIPGALFVSGDFCAAETITHLRACIVGDGVDLVLSDMAPNLSGIKSADQTRSLFLAESALEFAVEVLKPGGSFLVKVFQGPGIADFRVRMAKLFQTAVVRKPDASRSTSGEIYLLAKQFGS